MNTQHLLLFAVIVGLLTAAPLPLGAQTTNTFTGAVGDNWDVPGTGPEVEKDFLRMLRLIEESSVPLAALWVFDLPSQNADYNITADNERSYQLREVAEANARVQKGGTVRR